MAMYRDAGQPAKSEGAKAALSLLANRLLQLLVVGHAVTVLDLQNRTNVSILNSKTGEQRQEKWRGASSYCVIGHDCEVCEDHVSVRKLNVLKGTR